jgi:hypothetical protein
MKMSKSQLPISNRLPMTNLQLGIGEFEIDWDLALQLLFSADGERSRTIGHWVIGH